MKTLCCIVSVFCLLQSCSYLPYDILPYNQCKQYKTTDSIFRAYAETSSTSFELSEQKALNIVKKQIAEEIENYIVQKYGYKTFLTDSQYETKLASACKTILEVQYLNVACKRNVRRGSIYKTYIVVEISKKDVDSVIVKMFNVA